MVNIYTQLLPRRMELKDAAELKEFAGYISTGVSRMETLIQDLLAYSRAVHAGREELDAVEIIDLRVSLDDAIDVLAEQIKETSAVVTCEELPKITADRAQFAHVFQNLLSNALKYPDPDRPCRIHISAAQSSQEWTCYAERIFGLFKRLHKHEYPGTGLGLAICQRIVERYGGRMWAHSSPGKGSTFYFTVPVTDFAGVS